MSSLSMSNAMSILPAKLDALAHILRKSEAHATEAGYDPQVLMEARLAPDMHPLYRQAQIVCDLAKMAPYRVAGEEPPVYDESETTFAEIYTLIEKAKADIAKVTPDMLNGQEDREFSVKMGPRGEMPFTGIRYFSGFILPNLYFHLTTCYNILRHNGVPLGKLDYFGKSI